MATRNMREDELVAFGSAEEFERYENDDIQDKFDEDGEIESSSDRCDGGCSNDEGNGDACHEDSDCDVGDGDGSDDSDNGDGVDCDVGDGDSSDDSDNGDGFVCDVVMEMVVMTVIMEMALMKAQVIVHQLEQYAGRYRLDWSSPVCHLAFCAVIGTSYRTLKHWMQQVCSDSDIEPHLHGNCGRPPHHALSRLDKSRVVSFIRNYAAINALPDPGRLKGMVRDYVLESGKTMKSVYAEYCKIMEFLLKSTPAPQQPCPYRLTSGLKRQYTLLNVPPASPTRLTARAVNYISFITLWHSYNTNIEDAEKEWGRKRQKDRDQILGCLDSRIQLSPFTSHTYLDMQMQYSFDYCQQVSLPYSSQQRGTFYFRTPHKVQVFGVCCEPLSRQVFFLIDEAEQIAVVVVSQLHAFFHLHGLGEKRVTLQADNCPPCCGTCMAWRVITGQHERIQLNFMLPGHTKFRPDSYFGLFKKHYRRQDHVDDMDDLVDCVRQCGQNVTCVPQLCKDWQYYDWNIRR
eukprot:Em0012g51a